MKKTILAICFLSFLGACKEEQKETENNQQVTVTGDHLKIIDGSPILDKITEYTVKENLDSDIISSAGAIKAIPNHYAEISTPFAGRITKSFVKLGQKVSVGSPIFQVLSSEYFSVEKEYTDAMNDLQLATKNYKRQKDLVKHGVGIQKELEEAEADFNNKKSAVTNASSALKVFNTNVGKLGSPLVVRSPINGEVISNTIVNGQYLRDDSEPVVIIAELSKVWITGEVKEKDIRFINKGDKVSVHVSAYPDTNITGIVYHIDEIVDEATRSLKVLIECENPYRKLKPGMYATINYSTNPTNAINIPVSAIMQKDSEQYVWLKTSKNNFIRRKVTTSEASDSSNKTVKIISGLKSGDTVISQGGIYLLDAQ